MTVLADSQKLGGDNGALRRPHESRAEELFQRMQAKSERPSALLPSGTVALETAVKRLLESRDMDIVMIDKTLPFSLTGLQVINDLLSSDAPVVILKPLIRPGQLSGPVQFFAKLIERWGLSEAEACRLLGLDPEDSRELRRLLSGSTALRGRDANDRVGALLTLRRILGSLYRDDPDAERTWLRTPTPKLEGKAPLTQMTDSGMEGLLLVRDYLRWQSGL